MKRKYSDASGSAGSASLRHDGASPLPPNSIMSTRRPSAATSPQRGMRRFSMASSHSESPTGSRPTSRLDGRPPRAERRVRFTSASTTPRVVPHPPRADVDEVATTQAEQPPWSPHSRPERGVNGGVGRGAAVSGPRRVGRATAAHTAVVRVVTSFRGGAIPEYRGRMPRVGHTAVMYQRDVYVFGGVNDKGVYSSHLYVHEKRSLQWEERRGLGVVPLGRQNHSAILQDDHRMIIFGGHRGLEVLDDLYAYDFRTNRWEKMVYEKSQGPGPVFLHAAVYIPASQSMAVLGGFHQREHNMYVGHLFDIRNHVWSGIPAPAALNPQHLQLVTATYYEPRDAIVVIGLAETGAESSASPTGPWVTPSVYLLNVQTLGWTKVHTASSPESPIPFHMDLVWQLFMRDFVRTGGFHDEVQQSWYFPLQLGEVDEVVAPRPAPMSSVSMRSSSVAASTLAAPSAVAVSPHAARPRPRGRGRRPQYGFFKLQLTDMSWSIVPTQLSKKLLHALESGASEPRRVSASSRRRSSLLEGLHQNNSETAVRGGGSAVPHATRRALLYSVHGDPQYQRKYVFVAYREADPRRSRRPMEYLIMHGGLHPTHDYTMLMFTPLVTRVDALSAKKLTDVTDPAGASTSPTRSPTALLDWIDDEDDDDALGALHNRDAALPSSTGSTYLLPSVSERHAAAAAAATTTDDGVVAEESVLLPILPCTRTEHNARRVGLLFHPGNAVRNKSLLPYPDCPVAVLAGDGEVVGWSRDYYADTRRWLADRLRLAAAEDRQVRLLRRRLQGRNSSTGAVADRASDSSSDDAEGRARRRRASVRRASRLSSSLSARRPRSATTTASEDAAATRGGGEGHFLGLLLDDADDDNDALAVRSTSSEEQAARGDFFAEKGLNVFELYDLAPPSSSEEDADGDEVDLSRSDLSLPGLQRLRMMVKRHNEMQRLPASIFQRDSVDGIDVGDLGSAMAYVLLRNALAALPKNHSAEVQAQRARRRWRFLRTLVRTGEAAFIIYRVSQMQSKMKGLPITSTPGLLMAPELNLVSTTRSFKVPSRPIPYSLPRQPPQTNYRTEVTRSGMVAYQIKRN